MPRTQMAFLRPLLHSLKMTYGAPADLYYESADPVDLETGERAVVKEKWRCRRAVCLPTDLEADVLKSLARSGGGIELGDKLVLIDRRDLPGPLRVATHNYSVVIDRRRHEVLSVKEYEFAYLLSVKELTGARVYEHVDAFVREDLDGDGEVTGGP